MGWTAGTGAGLVPGLYGRFFSADADLARGRAARTDLAQGQARRRRSDGPLMDILEGGVPGDPHAASQPCRWQQSAESHRGRCTRRIILRVTMKWRVHHECSGPTAYEHD